VRAASTSSGLSAICINRVKQELRRITLKRLHCIGWLLHRAMVTRRSTSATCTVLALALQRTELKRCGGTSWRQLKGMVRIAALKNIGEYYEMGLSVAADRAEVIRWIHRAAAAGYSKAAVALKRSGVWALQTG